MEEYHGIIIDASQKFKSIFKNLRILGQKKSEKNKWVLYRIGVAAEGLEDTIQAIQNNMLPGYYFHIYRDGELVVVFKDRVFRIKPDKTTWNEAIEHGKSLGIPEEQLDFFPCKRKDETY